nr:Toxic cation resistance protein [Actinomycetota bacterium]
AQDNLERPGTEEQATPAAGPEQPPVEPEATAPKAEAPDTPTPEQQVEGPPTPEASADKAAEKPSKRSKKDES